jgi:hypothetical protein
MSALSTAIANIYEPQVWSKYFIELTTTKSLLVQSGIAQADPDVVEASKQGGRTVYMPFWADLPNSDSVASSVATDTDATITPTGLTTGEDIAVKHFRTKAWNVSPIVKYVAGDDPVRVVLSRQANWWAREEQRLLLKTLSGIFSDSTTATALSNDISGEVATTDPAKLISSEAIENTRFLLGDAYDKFTAIIMHSVPFKRLRSLDLIDDVPVSMQDPMAGTVPMYMGLRVLVDDSMTTASGSTSGTKYHTFLFGSGAIARVDIPLVGEDPNVELYRVPTQGTGAGSSTIITRKYFLLHPRGISYTGSLSGVVSPSDADLSSDNWTKVYSTKNIRIARLITNG